MRVTAIFGGPGTGKTTRLAELFGEAARKYGADKVAFVSFSRTQVYRGKSAVAKTGKARRKDLVLARTVLATARQSYGSPVDVAHGGDFYKMSKFVGADIDAVRRGVDYMKNVGTDNDSVGANIAGMDTRTFQRARAFYEKVKDGKSSRGPLFVDFGDMLEHAVETRHKVDCRAAFVDEAQDLSTLQWRAVYTFFRDADELYVAGDPNQALYRFTGGSAGYMKRMRTDSTVFLDRSRRCSENVMLMARRVWGMIDDRVEPPRGNGDKGGFAVFYPGQDVGRFLAPIKSATGSGKTVLVLAHTYFQLEKARERVLGGESVPHNFLSGRKKEWWGGKKRRKKVRLVFATVHQAKGLEADLVLYDTSQGDVGRATDFANEDSKWQDYWRMAYTAITRSKSMVVAFNLTHVRHGGQPTVMDVLYYTCFGREEFDRFCGVRPSAPSSTR